MPQVNYRTDSGRLLLAERCTDCGAPLADVVSGSACCDVNGNVYCCTDCRSEALATRWEDQAFRHFVEADYRD